MAIDLNTEVEDRISSDENIQNQIDVIKSGQLGSIKPTDAAPTPARNGNYTFSIGGNKPAWLTAEPLVTEVKAGDGVAVVYVAPSSYTYTHVDVSGDFVTILGLKLDKSAVKQTTGTSETDVMSQKTITESLFNKLEKHQIIEQGLYISDSFGNISLKIDVDGLDVVKISNHFLQLLEDMGISSGNSISGIYEIYGESFVIADPTGKIGFKFSKEGFIRFDETCELLSEVEYQI